MTGYEWWRAALVNPERIGGDLPIHDGHPQPGFYVIRSRKVWENGAARETMPEAVAIWHDAESGEMVAVAGIGEWAHHVDPADIWTWCAASPIPESLYRALSDGGVWPDEYLPKSFKGAAA